MSVKAKICGLTNLADAQAAVAAGADALGFNFYEKSPRFILLEAAVEIAKQIPPFVMRVGLFVNAPEDFVLRAISEAGLTMLQFHGDEPP
jgi:phosphoribosylanthranilate isomerase